MRFVVPIILACVCLASVASASVPSLMSFQGRIVDALGQPVNDTVEVTFSIYTVPAGGSAVWSEINGNVAVIDGLFSVLLGSMTLLTEDAFSKGVAYLGVKVGTDSEQSPRRQIVSSAFAFRIATVDDATGGTITSKVRIGTTNSNSGTNAFVAGSANSAGGTSSTVPGGDGNSASGNYSNVAGGQENHVSGDFSGIGAGGFNTVSGDSSYIGGGFSNLASNVGTVVTGGSRNRARGQFSFIGGGGGSDQADSNSASGDQAAIVGGHGHVAGGDGSFDGGGSSNISSYFQTAVVGGLKNRALGAQSAVVAGRYNKASGMLSFVGGGGDPQAIPGDSNVAGGTCSAVVGGQDNIANGKWSMILGGFSNRASGSLSFASGLRAQALHAGSFVWADSTQSNFVSTGINQFLVRASGGVGMGTNNPLAPLHVQEGSSGVAPNGSSVAVFERSASTYLSLLTPWDNERGVLFGDIRSNVDGGMVYNSAGLRRGLQLRTGGNSTRMVIDSLGNVGIADNTPEERLKVVGNILASGCVIGSNIACPSDERLKKNITEIDDALKSVEQLRGVNYEWNRDKFPDREFASGNQIGVLAQDVQKVAPEAVVKMADGYLAVDYSRLVPLLIQGMKEQQRQIDDLQKKVKSLETTP